MLIKAPVLALIHYNLKGITDPKSEALSEYSPDNSFSDQF
jgi:hypothetical protein